jgi:hypothetical protein
MPESQVPTGNDRPSHLSKLFQTQEPEVRQPAPQTNRRRISIECEGSIQGENPMAAMARGSTPAPPAEITKEDSPKTAPLKWKTKVRSLILPPLKI